MQSSYAQQRVHLAARIREILGGSGGPPTRSEPADHRGQRDVPPPYSLPVRENAPSALPGFRPDSLKHQLDWNEDRHRGVKRLREDQPSPLLSPYTSQKSVSQRHPPEREPVRFGFGDGIKSHGNAAPASFQFSSSPETALQATSGANQLELLKDILKQQKTRDQEPGPAHHAETTSKVSELNHRFAEIQQRVSARRQPENMVMKHAERPVSPVRKTNSMDDLIAQLVDALKPKRNSQPEEEKRDVRPPENYSRRTFESLPTPVKRISPEIQTPQTISMKGLSTSLERAISDFLGESAGTSLLNSQMEALRPTESGSSAQKKFDEYRGNVQLNPSYLRSFGGERTFEEPASRKRESRWEAEPKSLEQRRKTDSRFPEQRRDADTRYSGKQRETEARHTEKWQEKDSGLPEKRREYESRYSGKWYDSDKRRETDFKPAEKRRDYESQKPYESESFRSRYVERGYDRRATDVSSETRTSGHFSRTTEASSADRHQLRREKPNKEQLRNAPSARELTHRIRELDTNIQLHKDMLTSADKREWTEGSTRRVEAQSELELGIEVARRKLHDAETDLMALKQKPLTPLLKLQIEESQKIVESQRKVLVAMEIEANCQRTQPPAVLHTPAPQPLLSLPVAPPLLSLTPQPADARLGGTGSGGEEVRQPLLPAPDGYHRALLTPLNRAPEPGPWPYEGANVPPRAPEPWGRPFPGPRNFASESIDIQEINGYQSRLAGKMNRLKTLSERMNSISTNTNEHRCLLKDQISIYKELDILNPHTGEVDANVVREQLREAADMLHRIMKEPNNSKRATMINLQRVITSGYQNVLSQCNAKSPAAARPAAKIYPKTQVPVNSDTDKKSTPVTQKRALSPDKKAPVPAQKKLNAATNAVSPQEKAASSAATNKTPPAETNSSSDSSKNTIEVITLDDDVEEDGGMSSRRLEIHQMETFALLRKLNAELENIQSPSASKDAIQKSKEDITSYGQEIGVIKESESSLDPDLIANVMAEEESTFKIVSNRAPSRRNQRLTRRQKDLLEMLKALKKISEESVTSKLAETSNRPSIQEAKGASPATLISAQRNTATGSDSSNSPETNAATSALPAQGGTPSTPTAVSASPAQGGTPAKPVASTASPAQGGTPAKPAAAATSVSPAQGGTPAKPAAMPASLTQSGTPAKPTAVSASPTQGGTPAQPATTSASPTQGGTPTKPALTVATPAQSGTPTKSAPTAASPSQNGNTAKPLSNGTDKPVQGGTPANTPLQSTPASTGPANSAGGKNPTAAAELKRVQRQIKKLEERLAADPTNQVVICGMKMLRDSEKELLSKV